MASWTRSWNTVEVTYDAATGGATLGPLKTVEMERQMGLDDDYTKLEGVTDKERHKQIGNAFHAAVMQHDLECWVKCVVVTKDFDSTLGFPGEGRLYGLEYDGLWRIGSSAQNACAMRETREGSRLRRRPACRSRCASSWAYESQRQWSTLERCDARGGSGFRSWRFVSGCCPRWE